MIAGFTHLTMEADLSAGIALGTELGFSLDFVDELLLPGGFEGVEEGEQRLPLALLTGAHGIRFEVVQHRALSGAVGAYSGLFRGLPPRTASARVARPQVREVLLRAGVMTDPECVALEASGAEAWFDLAGDIQEKGGLAGLLCYVTDVRAEADFWSRFARIRWKKQEADAAWASIPSLLPQTRCELVIVERDGPQTTHGMNDSGFPSIGVFSTAIERDCAAAAAAGAAVRAEPIVTTVGGRALRMALIETPGGAPVELLGAHRSAA